MDRKQLSIRGWPKGTDPNVFYWGASIYMLEFSFTLTGLCVGARHAVPLQVLKTEIECASTWVGPHDALI